MSERKEIWLKKEEDILLVQASGYKTDQGFCQIDATVELYDLNLKRLATLYGILGPMENEVKDLESRGST